MHKRIWVLQHTELNVSLICSARTAAPYHFQGCMSECVIAHTLAVRLLPLDVDLTMQSTVICAG